MAARPQKRREEGTHEPDMAARSQKRREDGAHEPDLAARSQKRRADGAHENAGSRDMRRQARPSSGADASDTELDLRKLCHGGGSPTFRGAGESCRARKRRHLRMRFLARRTGRVPTWSDEASVGDRDTAIGLKVPSRVKEGANMRANRKL